jgi:hypothetical protein
MTPEPEDSDDYGYDLAHEVKTALRIPSPVAAPPRTAAPAVRWTRTAAT